jgi:hypothetical protein
MIEHPILGGSENDRRLRQDPEDRYGISLRWLP